MSLDGAVALDSPLITPPPAHSSLHLSPSDPAGCWIARGSRIAATQSICGAVRGYGTGFLEDGY